MPKDIYGKIKDGNPDEVRAHLDQVKQQKADEEQRKRDEWSISKNTQKKNQALNDIYNW